LDAVPVTLTSTAAAVFVTVNVNGVAPMRRDR
jgi:hypothetical protein